MSITAYEYLSILKSKDKQVTEQQSGDFDYDLLLEKLRKIIAEKHSKELSGAMGSPLSVKSLKALILKYCVEELSCR